MSEDAVDATVGSVLFQAFRYEMDGLTLQSARKGLELASETRPSAVGNSLAGARQPDFDLTSWSVSGSIPVPDGQLKPIEAV